MEFKKELDLALANIAQKKAEENMRNEKAKKYSTRIKRERRLEIIKGCMAIALIFVCAGIVGKMDYESEIKANAAIESEIETEQKHIVRYGVTSEWGSIIETEDGNIWTLEDAPEFEDGTEVRVLFDSNETVSSLDDVIIDVVER